MESLLQMSESAMEANIGYYTAKRNEAVEQALEAQAQIDKWSKLKEMKNNPRPAIEKMLTSDCY